MSMRDVSRLVPALRSISPRGARGWRQRAAAPEAICAPRAAPTRAASTLPWNAADFEGVRRELGEAKGLPGACYTDPDWHKAELEHVFRPTWLLVGRQDELPKIGSYITIDAPGMGPVVVVRSKDGQVRAFANVCRHRGAILLRKESGALKGGIICPYHAWAYGLDGKLKGAPKTRRKDPDAPVCFDRKEYPLLDVRLEEFGGFLFINGSSDAPSLADCLGNCADLVLGRWPLEDLVTVGRRDYVVECNWKFLFENTSETYHTSYVHKDSLGAMPSAPVSERRGVDPTGNWDALYVPGDRSVVPLPGEAAPFPNVADETFFTNLWPSLQVNATHDCVWWMRMLPLGPTRSRVTQAFLFPKETTKMAGFEELLEPYRYRWDLAVREDNEISENQQDGVSSALYVPGPYQELEFATHRFDRFIVDTVLGAYGR